MQVATQNSTVPKLRFKEFDKGWSKVNLNKITDVITKGTTPKKFSEKGVSFVKIESLNGIQITKKKCLFIEQEIHLTSLKRSILKENDILFAIAGATVGKVGLVTNDILPANTNQALAIIRLSNNVNLNYVLQILQSNVMQKYICKSISVGAQPNLSLKQINEFSFYLPPLPEQEKIASFLSAVDERIQKLERKKTLLEDYKKGLMRQLFSQEIRFKDENGNNYPDWEEKKLGDVGVFKSGTAFSNSEQGGNKGVSFLKVSDMNLTGNEFRITKANNYVNKEQIDRLKYKITISPSIIFAKVGAAIFLERKRIASNFLIDNNMMSFTPSGDIIFFKNLFDRIRLSKFAQVGALPSYNASDLKTIKLNLPCLNEQQKIASFLNGIDKKIELVETQIQQSKTFKKGLLQQLFV